MRDLHTRPGSPRLQVQRETPDAPRQRHPSPPGEGGSRYRLEVQPGAPELSNQRETPSVPRRRLPHPRGAGGSASQSAQALLCGLGVTEPLALELTHRPWASKAHPCEARGHSDL